MNEILLSIIIVTWNVKACIEACLASIENITSALSHELIVIDNASSDGTANFVKQLRPNAQIISLTSNIGFPAANNVAIKKARGKYILLLNPDTIVQPDAIIKMIQYLELHPQVALVGPRTYDASGKDQKDAARRNPTLCRVLVQSFGLSFFLPKSGVLESLRICLSNRDQTKDVDMISGACMLFPKEVIHKVGYLDEEIFLDAEDMDFCYRIRKAGYRVIYLHNAKIVHLKGQSQKQVPIFSREIDFVANEYFYKKHFGTAKAALRRLIWIPGAVLRIVAFSFLTILINGQRRATFNNVVAYTNIFARLIGFRKEELRPRNV